MNAVLEPAGVVHFAAASWVLLAGGVQLARAKGTLSHRALGWSWMIAISVVAISSFWMHDLEPIVLGLGPIHFLSLWTLFCVAASLYLASRKNITGHRNFAVGAYIGTVVAGFFAFYGSNRVLHIWLFGA